MNLKFSRGKSNYSRIIVFINIDLFSVFPPDLDEGSRENSHFLFDLFEQLEQLEQLEQQLSAKLNKSFQSAVEIRTSIIPNMS